MNKDFIIGILIQMRNIRYDKLMSKETMIDKDVF